MFAGLRLALSLSLILMVFSELVGSSNGIGYQLVNAQSTYDLPAMWAAVLLLGVLGYLLNTLSLGTERVLLRWHRAAGSVSDGPSRHNGVHARTDVTIRFRTGAH